MQGWKHLRTIKPKTLIKIICFELLFFQTTFSPSKSTPIMPIMKITITFI